MLEPNGNEWSGEKNAEVEKQRVWKFHISWISCPEEQLYTKQFAIFNKSRKKRSKNVNGLQWTQRANEKETAEKEEEKKLFARQNTHEKSIDYRLLNFVN